MIVSAISELLLSIFTLLTTPINIPSLPENVSEIMAQYLDYLKVGIEFVSSYTHMGYLLTLFGIIIAVDIGMMLYKFIMWVLRKIPMIGLS